MRIPVLAAALAACLTAAEPPPPAGAQKLLDEAVVATSKARQTFAAAAKKEQDKLVAALTKEQEKETKKGNLDGALAIKSMIEQVQAGLLEKRIDAAKDLLGEGPKGAGSKTSPYDAPPAGLSTTCPIASSGAGGGEAPPQLAAFMTRAVRLTIPKGDPARYQFTCRQPGLVAVCTGPSERHHAELWKQLGQAGFKRLEGEEHGAWFVLEATPQMQFALADVPSAGMEIMLFAGQIRQQR